MMSDEQRLTGHDTFMELGALASTGTLSVSELNDLRDHLENCADCSTAYDQFVILNARMSLLAPACHRIQRRPFSEVLRRFKKPATAGTTNHWSVPVRFGTALGNRPLTGPMMVAASLVLCLAVTIALWPYRHHNEISLRATQPRPEDQTPKLTIEKRGMETLLREQATALSRLQGANAQKQRELLSMRSMMSSLETRAKELSADAAANDAKLQDVTKDRNRLDEQLAEARQAYEGAEAELTQLQAEKERTILRLAALESSVHELSAINSENESKLQKDEQYLAYDGDIRELMGARKLYIADVFERRQQ